MNYITPIDSLEQENNSGILEIWIAKIDDVQHPFPRVIAGIIQGDIIFKAGRDFVKWHVIQGSSQFASNAVDSMEGVARKQSLPFTLPGKMINENTLSRMEKDRFLVVYKDANLKQIAIGSPEAPLEFRYAHSTGALGTGRNEFTCEFFSSASENKSIYRKVLASIALVVAVFLFNTNGPLLAVVRENETYTHAAAAFRINLIVKEKHDLLNSGTAIINDNPVQLGKNVIVQCGFSKGFRIV